MARIAAILASACAVAAAAPPTTHAPPCFVTINDLSLIPVDARVIESPCFATIYAAGPPSFYQVVLRSYPRDAAMLVEASIPDDPGNTFAQNLFYTSSFIFGYFSGDYNSEQKNISNALTAPFILRPVSAERGGDLTWVGAMALAPSLWPAGSSPPAPSLPNINVRPFGDVVIASVPALLPAAPTEDDFRRAYLQLEELVNLLALPGTWVINVSSPLTPSYSFFFNEAYNGSSYLIEASAEVYFQPPPQKAGHWQM